jgi:hypothetical protein
MGRNDFKNSVQQSLTNMLADSEVGSGTGVAKFIRSDKKTIGKLYLKQGKAYAIEVTNYPIGLLRRVLSSEFIAAEHREQILNRFQKEQSSPEIIDYLLTYQLMPERELTNFVKDQFLGAVDELFSWENVNAEWRNGEETEAFTVPFVEPSKLQELANNRRIFLENVAEAFGLDVEKLNNLKFKQIAEPTAANDLPQAAPNLLSIGKGEFEVREAATQFGLSMFLAKQALYKLWSEEIIEMIYNNEFPIRHVTPVPETPESFPADPALSSSLPNEPTQPEEQVAPAIENETPVLTDDNFDEIPVEVEADEEEVMPTMAMEEDIPTESVEEEEPFHIIEASPIKTLEVSDSAGEDELPLEAEEPEDAPAVTEVNPVVDPAPEEAFSPLDSITESAKRLVDVLEKNSSAITSKKQALVAKQEKVEKMAQSIQDQIEELNTLKDSYEADAAALEKDLEQHNEILALIKKIG